MRCPLLAIFLFISHLSFGQFQKVINKSFDTQDIAKVSLDLKGEISYQEWEGMFLLVETKVVIENCNENIFNSFMAAGRYTIDSTIEGDRINLSSNKALGKVVNTKRGAISEKVYFVVYFPKGFKDGNGNPLLSTIKHVHEADSN